MSKHHQSSRRKSYGRRQHEVRERHDRHHQPEGFELEYGETSNVVPSRPVRLPRPARAAPPPRVGRLTMAVYQGARPRTIALGGRPRIAEGPTLGRRAHAHRGPGRPPPGPLEPRPRRHRRSRSCSRSSGSPRTSGCPRPATTSAGCRSPATGWTRRAQDLHSDLSRLGREPAIRKLALDAGSASSATPSSCRPARRSSEPCWVGPIRDAAAGAAARLRRGRVRARRPARRTGRSSQRDDLAAKAVAQTTIQVERAQPARRHLRPDRDGRPGHDRRARPARRRAEGPDRRSSARRPATSSSASWASTTRPRPRSATSSLSGKAYVILAREIEPAVADQIRAASRRPAPHRDLARGRAAAGLPAGRRRPRLDARGAPPRLRQPRGHRPVRRRAGLPGHARRLAPDRGLPARRARPADPRDRDRRLAGHGRPGRPPDHRRRPPAGGRAGAARGLDRRRGQERLGRRHGPVHGRGLRRGDLSVVRRQRLPRDRGEGTRSASSTRSSRTSTSPGRSSR